MVEQFQSSQEAGWESGIPEINNVFLLLFLIPQYKFLSPAHWCNKTRYVSNNESNKTEEFHYGLCSKGKQPKFSN